MKRDQVDCLVPLHEYARRESRPPAARRAAAVLRTVATYGVATEFAVLVDANSRRSRGWLQRRGSRRPPCQRSTQDVLDPPAAIGKFRGAMGDEGTRSTRSWTQLIGSTSHASLRTHKLRSDPHRAAPCGGENRQADGRPPPCHGQSPRSTASQALDWTVARCQARLRLWVGR